MELKELYIAPEAELIGFMAVERLAFDITLEGGGTNDGDGSVIFGENDNNENGEA